MIKQFCLSDVYNDHRYVFYRCPDKAEEKSGTGPALKRTRLIRKLPRRHCVQKPELKSQTFESLKPRPTAPARCVYHQNQGTQLALIKQIGLENLLKKSDKKFKKSVAFRVHRFHPCSKISDYLCKPVPENRDFRCASTGWRRPDGSVAKNRWLI